MASYFKEDLRGKRYGNLTVLRFVPDESTRMSYWLCLCDCGQERVVYAGHLKKGHTTSCGSMVHRIGKHHCSDSTKEKISKAKTKHGGSKERLFRVWASMLNRCENKNEPAYRWYGERGITVCHEWHDYGTFRLWAESSGYDATAKTHECSIDRIDTEKGYYPENCRWVGPSEQSNNRRSNRLFTYNGVTKNIKGWADEYGLRYGLLNQRLIRDGWTIERALNTPVKTQTKG